MAAGHGVNRSSCPTPPEGTAGYVYAGGFGEIYGDYGEIDITSAGKTIAV
jgi:hypothetical protein